MGTNKKGNGKVRPSQGNESKGNVNWDKKGNDTQANDTRFKTTTPPPRKK